MTEEIDPIDEIRAYREKIARKFKTVSAYLDYLHSMPMDADSVMERLKEKKARQDKAKATKAKRNKTKQGAKRRTKKVAEKAEK